GCNRHGQSRARICQQTDGQGAVVATAGKRGDAAPFHAGDRVRFRFGLGDVVGEITEVIGPIAKGRRMLYHIEFSMGRDQPPLATELTADEFERVD
ncbi:MAG: hypothetical protein ACREUF_17240, partial [Solimonas sp.]